MADNPKISSYPGLFFLTSGAVLGVFGFFSLPIAFWLLVSFLGVVLLFGVFTGRSALIWLVVGAMVVCLSANWQTRAISMTGLETAGTYAAIGRLTYQEPSQGGYRLWFEVLLPDGDVPVRLTYDQPLNIGGLYQIAFWATPVSGPLYPGGFDPRFKFAFKGVQGFGRLNQAHLISKSSSQALTVWQKNLRFSINQRVRQHLPDQRGAFVRAILTGVRGGLNAHTLEIFRVSGLSHLLAISGLHLSLLAGFAFATSRALFWVFPVLNLFLDQRKISTLVAMASAIGYFFLSGAGVPTQRALILVLVAGGIFLAGRRALTWRLWAMALTIVLVIGPYHVFSLSTQLSFLAVAILIRTSDFISRWSDKGSSQDKASIGRFRQWGIGLLGATFAVNLLTIPVLLLAFGQAPAMGAFANIFAVPFAGGVLIPLSFLALVTMPFGGEGPILAALGTALDVLFVLAEMIAGLPFVELGLLKSPLPLIWPLLFAFACLLYPGWRSWQGPGVAAVAIICIIIVPIWLPKPIALHHPSGWVLKYQESGGFMDAGVEPISEYDFSQVGQLWQTDLGEASIRRANPQQQSQATAVSGPILIYKWGERNIRVPDSWFWRNADMF